jgi:glyoxylase-like metal-dependent hydrolase (beta-lactamase superfamily II)
VTVEIRRVRAGITNTYILRHRGTVVIDPGGPPPGPLAAAALRRILGALGTPPVANLIVITHAHVDHVAAAPALKALTGAVVATHRDDAAKLTTGRTVWPPGITPWGRLVRALMGPLVLRLPVVRFTPDILLNDDGMDLEPYGIPGSVIHTPGHSAGSVSVVLRSGDAFVGDLAMSFPACGHPQFGIFAEHPERLNASWERLLNLGVHTVHPAHGRAFRASALRDKQNRRGSEEP